MKIYLASYLEKHNFGPGKIFAIADTKPKDFDINEAYTFFIPAPGILENYKKKQLEDQQEAANYFNLAFKSQLDSFVEAVLAVNEKEGTAIFDLLPFNDGDTLLSWERDGFTSYRPAVAECLKKLGYEVLLK